MSTFVLVHGAWHGGWSWYKVRSILEQLGHRVFTPTITGVGERLHLMSDNISMDSIVSDIANVLKFENLNNVILVGHSFGGAVISGVAEREPDRVKQLIYLDAAILENGESMFSCMHPELAAERKRIAEETSNGMSLPIPSAANLGMVEDREWAYVKQHLTPHPLSSYDTPLSLNKAPGCSLPCSYIVCTSPLYIPLAWARRRAESYEWPIIQIDAGHNALISAPDELSQILLEQIREHG